MRTYIRYEINAIRMVLDAGMEGLTDAEFNWAPPGTANSIAANFLHLVSGEDYFINKVFQGKDMLWQTGGWGDKTGIGSPPGGPGAWEIGHADLTQCLAYQAAVREVVDAYIDAATDEELARTVSFLEADRPIGEVLAFLGTHSMGHCGEIAAVKGMQGLSGLPF